MRLYIFTRNAYMDVQIWHILYKRLALYILFIITINFIAIFIII